jgi:hypothetical protein
MRVGSLYLENFKEIARAVSDRHGRDEVGVEEYAIKFFTETYLQEHESLFDVKRGGQITYLGGSSAKVGVPDGVDEPTPVDEFDTDDGYSEVTDEEKLDFDADQLTNDGDEESEQVEEQSDSDDDGDPDDGDDEGKLTFSMSEGPPSSDDE